MSQRAFGQSNYAPAPLQEMTGVAQQQEQRSISNVQGVHVQQNGWNSYPLPVTAQPTGHPSLAAVLAHPPVGQWRDNICDCCNNLWPSCGCTVCFHGLGAAWIVSQISQKTVYMRFNTIMQPFVIIWCIAWLIFWISGERLGVIFFIPGLMIYVIGIMLRFHVVKTFQLEENCMTSCLAGCCCWACSVAQMARHVYGYNMVFDGDSNPERADGYRTIVEQPVQQQPVQQQHSAPFRQNNASSNPNVTYVSGSV